MGKERNGDGGRFRRFRRQYLVNKYKAKKRGRHKWIASISMIFVCEYLDSSSLFEYRLYIYMHVSNVNNNGEVDLKVRNKSCSPM